MVMRMKTFREYLNDSEFEEIWSSITEHFSEPPTLKEVYTEYYNKLKLLPTKPSKDIIEVANCPALPPEGMNAAPDWLIDKMVKTTHQDSAYVSAVLLYWASLHTFITSKEHDDDLCKYLSIIESDNCQALGLYFAESIKPDPLGTAKQDSLDHKEKLFWDETFNRSSPGDWRGILYVLKRKLEYDMGFMRGFADHAGRDHDADRMQLCCRLIDIATADIYPDEKSRKALRLLFKILEKDITDWSD